MERTWRFQRECDDEITPRRWTQEPDPISRLRVRVRYELPQAENNFHSSIVEMRPYVESYSCGITSKFGIRELSDTVLLASGGAVLESLRVSLWQQMVH